MISLTPCGGGRWQGIHQESASADGSGVGDEAACAAAGHAAALMADPQAANDEIALMFLPWLVGAAPPQALTVLKVLCLSQFLALLVFVCC